MTRILCALAFALCVAQVSSTACETDTQCSGLAKRHYCVHGQCNTCTPAPMLPEDRQALEDFYGETNGQFWLNHDNWIQKSDPCDVNALWVGLVCAVDCHDVNPATIGSLDLSSNNVSGNIGTSQLWKRPGNFNILLANNSLTGNIPPVGPKRTIAAFGVNHMTGISSDSIPEQNNLQSLQLSYNDFNCSISELLHNVKGGFFSVLAVDHNQLTGAFPVSFLEAVAPRTHLSIFNIAHNKLSGPLPAFMQTEASFRAYLPSVRHWDVSGNNWTGAIPEWCGSSGNGLCSPIA